MSADVSMGGPAQPLPTLGNRTETTEPKRKTSNIRYPFWFGGSATSMAACVTHPFDLVRVRLQTRAASAPRSMSGTFLKILKSEGPLGLYSGISASVLRQLTYSTVRFGLYEELKQRAGPETSFPLLVAMATSSGFVGGLAGNFADVLNVRMQNDTALPAHMRRNYKHAVDGLVRMTREEGARSWFRGWLPNCTRAAATTAGQLATYDIAKRLLLDYTPLEDTLTTQLLASFMAGLTTATVTNPIDVVKTRAMSAEKKQGMFELVGELSRAQGVRWVVRGWVPSFLRQGPHTICIFLFLEMHRKLYRQFKGLE
ncbi:mitochondrial carrier [Trematosphaeria pertusa]|uniref:Mitochondrial carrier n=1 Tax=Trematosphaeria pertusa TaxID=390896 RepID=A0A6A6IMM7_9PLEO|nr:mitochondrial carrier [Trematosphaeria pertusa]KAF2250820.1 mitochondrial carrier [Trematosphaeria pertusa]